MYVEFYEMMEEIVVFLNEVRKVGGCIVLVGMILMCIFEIIVGEYDGVFIVLSGWMFIFIYLGYEFKVIDGMIINFYLLKFLFIMFVFVFVGREYVFFVYCYVVEEEYCFFSFGDVMLII